MGVFERLGRACARRRWPVVAAWLALALAALPFAPRAPGALHAGGFSSPDLEASVARRLLEERLDLPPSALVILVESTTGARAGDPGFDAAVLRAIAAVSSAEHVTGIWPHTLAPAQVSAD